MLQERRGGRVTRRTQARTARLCGAEIVAEDVTMQVLSPQAEAARWTLTTPTAWLATHEDRARFGRVELLGQDGERWRAEGGAWDGERRQLTLMGPACGQRGGHAVCAQAAQVHFADDSSEVDWVELRGDVKGTLLP